MTDRGTPTPENVANKPKRRFLNVANGFLLAGALIGGAGVAESVIIPILDGGFTATSASAMVSDYKNTSEALARAGELDQLPQKFDSQQLAQAFKKHDVDVVREALGVGGEVAGIALLFVGVSRRSERRYREKYKPHS